MNFLPDFSHIYVESQSIDSDIAEQSFKRFPKAKIIEIEDYKKIFNKTASALSDDFFGRIFLPNWTFSLRLTRR